MNSDLKADPELNTLIRAEHDRQASGIELIASENFAPTGVLQCLGSVLTNKYSEGQPGRRYYGGNQFIDEIENLAKERALKAFNLNPMEWHVNVQPYSGSPANFAVFTALLKPHDRIMGLDLPSGGHLTHGFSLPTGKRVSATSLFFESMPYRVFQSGERAGWIDYDELALMATRFRPRILICGASAYPRDFDYARIRAIADECGALLMADIAHISGFVATGLMSDPFTVCDVVTTTTHKTLGGPRAGMIFVRKTDRLTGKETNWPTLIDDTVFPALQGGPHNHQIAGIAYQLGQVADPGFRDYMAQVRENARSLANELITRGCKISTDGTDNHIVLVNLSGLGITGSKLEKVCEMVDISVNKNSVPGDTNMMNPSGVRLGTAAMTTRGCQEGHMVRIADFLMRAVKITQAAQAKYGVKLVDFLAGIRDDAYFQFQLDELRTDVNLFSQPLKWYDTVKYGI
jgi:glycine hydroxymethyltransferase